MYYYKKPAKILISNIKQHVFTYDIQGINKIIFNYLVNDPFNLIKAAKTKLTAKGSINFLTYIPNNIITMHKRGKNIAQILALNLKKQLADYIKSSGNSIILLNLFQNTSRIAQKSQQRHDRAINALESIKLNTHLCKKALKYVVNPPNHKDIKQLNIIILDDIATTNSTLLVAVKLLISCIMNNGLIKSIPIINLFTLTIFKTPKI